MDATVAVADVRSVGPNTVVIELSTPEGFDACPGQFVRVGTTIEGEEYARFYTLSSPTVDDTFEITVGLDSEEGGPFSRYLSNVEVGDELDISGPLGSNYYEGESRVVVLAGGPGIGPAVGIGERAVDDGNDVAVVYRDDEPAHVDRLDALREAGATVAVVDGPIEDRVADVLTGDDGEQVYVYGFSDFVDEATAALREAGVAPEDAKVENFG